MFTEWNYVENGYPDKIGNYKIKTIYSQTEDFVAKWNREDFILEIKPPQSH